MKVECLVATMNQEAQHTPALLERMNIQTDAVAINQCGRVSYDTFAFRGRTVRVISTAERGVGRSRNRALAAAKGDICLFSDDDVTYVDGYADQLLAAFAAHPEADVLTFNMASRGVERHRKEIRRPGRVRWYSYMRYATNRLAVRRTRVEAAGICFSEHFGGGCRYGSGEDTIFLHDCLKRGLKIYAVPICLGETDDTSSTWFGGYDEKFFFDKGALFGAIYGGPGIIFCAAFVLRHRVFFQGERPLKRTHAFTRMCMGMREYLREYGAEETQGGKRR